MYGIRKRTALITGASKRIGRSIALRLAESGMNIVVHYNTSEKGAIDLEEALQQKGVQSWIVKADLSSRTEAETLVTRATKEAGKIDVLVNNASVFRPSRITEFSLSELDITLQINTLSPLILSREFAGQTKEGVIVNLLDTRVSGTDNEHAAYSMSKKMLLESTHMLALELAPYIRVSAVAPGLILPPPGKDQDYLLKMTNGVPLKTHGTPEDIGEAVHYLVTNDFVTGQVIYVDGGQHLRSGNYNHSGGKSE